MDYQDHIKQKITTEIKQEMIKKLGYEVYPDGFMGHIPSKVMGIINRAAERRYKVLKDFGKLDA